MVSHCSPSKLTDWTSEGWVEDKMTSKTHWLKIAACKRSLLYMQKFETPALHINLGACTRFAFLN